MSKKNKPTRVRLIANPGAGNVAETANNLKLVVDCLEKSGLKVDVTFARPKEEATPLARQAVKDGCKIVIAMGGDGTLEAVMHGLIGSKVRLGIIPTGIENNIAQSLGIPKDLEKACALISSDNTLKLDLGQVTTRKGKKFVFFEMATIGLADAVYAAAQGTAFTENLPGIKATALTLIRSNQETQPKVILTLDNEKKVEVETMLVMVSANTPGFGNNTPATAQTTPSLGMLEISVYPDFGKIELLRYYAALMDGGYSGESKVKHFQANKLKIKTSPRLDVMADGVALGKGTVTIKVRPGALRVITTRQSPEPQTLEITLPGPAVLIGGKNHNGTREVSAQ